MKCNVVKVKKEFKDSNGKTRFSYNYYLVLENGETIGIVPKYYDVEGVKDQTRYESLVRANVANATKLSMVADSVEHEK